MSLDLGEKRRNFLVSLRKDAIKELMDNRRRAFVGGKNPKNLNQNEGDPLTKRQVHEND